MDFVPSDDQLALQETLRKQLAARFPMAEIRARQDLGLNRERWRELGEAGVFSLRVPHDREGVGLGMAESVLVFEELGRALVPGPLVATELAARANVIGAGAGETVVGVIEHGDRFVEHLESLDQVGVVDDDGIWLLAPAEVTAKAVTTNLDPLTPIHRVTSLGPGSQIGGPDAARIWRVEGAVLTAALQLGIAEAVMDAAVAYAKQRVQFDKPIGAFQAVKHMLADMLVRTEIARAAVYGAGVTVDDPSVGDTARAASVAKVLAGEAALANAKACIQVHGGMGFTWEVDAHLYLKRAWVLETAFGSGENQAQALAAML